MERKAWEQRLRSGAAESGFAGEGPAMVRAAAGRASSSAVAQSEVRLGLVAAREGGGPAIACTLDGVEAIEARVAEWQDIVGRAADRHRAAGGVTLVYEHNQQLAADLARLAAAEFDCCSFFTFALTFGPGGMVFTVTAPKEAGDAVTAMFGVYGTSESDGRNA